MYNKLATGPGRRRGHGCCSSACVFNLKSVRGCCPGPGPRPCPGPSKFAAAGRARLPLRGCRRPVNSDGSSEPAREGGPQAGPKILPPKCHDI